MGRPRKNDPGPTRDLGFKLPIDLVDDIDQEIAHIERETRMSNVSRVQAVIALLREALEARRNKRNC